MKTRELTIHLQKKPVLWIGPGLSEKRAYQAIASLAGTGRLAAIVLAAADSPLEQALGAAGVDIVVRTPDQAEEAPAGTLRLLKLRPVPPEQNEHVLSNMSSNILAARCGALLEQLEALLAHHPLLAIGCDLNDPLLLNLLATQDARPGDVKPWCVIVQPSSSASGPDSSRRPGDEKLALVHAHLELLRIDRLEDLPALLLAVAKNLTDLDLLAGWRGGDRGMGSALYQRYAEPISAFFRRNVSDRAAVEDLTQETFIALRESKAEIENVSAYLFRIAFFKFTHHVRGLKRFAELGDDDTHTVAGDLIPDPEYIRGQREDTRLLLRAIRRLPLIHQQVLELSFWAEKSGPEIAEILDVPIGTVASRLRHAKAKLDAKLQELAGSPEALRSTTMNVEQWRKRIQGLLDQAPADEDLPPRPSKSGK